MKINWFPGHMKKTLQMMREEVKNIDAIIYVLDSRAPFSSLNPSFLNIIKEKPILFVLNKVDLVEKSAIEPFLQKLSKRPKSDVITLEATKSISKQKIINSLEKILKDKIEYFKSKGAKITQKVMIIGIPNSGKSTLANTLAGKVKAETGNRAGVTKSKQWIKVNPYLEVLDTPGTLWPSLTNVKVAENLAFIGSIKSEVLDSEEIAFAFIERIRKFDQNSLEKRYLIQIGSEDSTLDILNKIATQKGFKIKGGEIDYGRVYSTLLLDYKNGKLTRKILDGPEVLCRL